MLPLPTFNDALFAQLASPAPWLILWGALALHYVFPFKLQHGMAQIADAIAEKVNHHSHQQQRLAGRLATILLLVAIMLLLAIGYGLLSSPWVNFLLLLSAVNLTPLTRQIDLICRHLDKDNKPQARALLATLVNRDTVNLSALGIAKTTSETMILGYARTLNNVVFWFALTNGAGAFLYASIVVLARTWSVRLAHYRYFGQTPAQLLTLLDWLPNRLFALLFCIGKRAKTGLTALRDQAQQATNWRGNGADWLLASAAARLGLTLGGPASYDGDKLPRAQFGQGLALDALQLDFLHQELKIKSALWLGLITGLMIF